jgi:ATP-dependent DNA ligase
MRCRRCRWLKPRLVAAIEFLEWTPENKLRHPKFVGLGEDKNPREVRRLLPHLFENSMTPQPIVVKDLIEAHLRKAV